MFTRNKLKHVDFQAAGNVAKLRHALALFLGIGGCVSQIARKLFEVFLLAGVRGLKLQRPDRQVMVRRLLARINIFAPG